MAHKSLIVCDKCGTEGRADGAPYPEGWVIATVSSWIAATDSSPRLKSAKEKDLCPKCAEPVVALLA